MLFPVLFLVDAVHECFMIYELTKPHFHMYRYATSIKIMPGTGVETVIKQIILHRVGPGFSGLPDHAYTGITYMSTLNVLCDASQTRR